MPGTPPTATISFLDSDGVTFLTGSALAHASTNQVTLGTTVIQVGDKIRATLSDIAGAAAQIKVILHCEE